MDLGLGYESSDEEDIAPVSISQKPVPKSDDNAPGPVLLPQKTETGTKTSERHSSIPEPQPSYPSADQGPINGPALGPGASPPPTLPRLPEDAPGSPYTIERQIIRNLTLPTVPSFHIPSSPPGSPPLRATKKFAQFLDLKEKGQHFNQRLESSTVLRDPAHLPKLMEFAGFGEEDQYASTLPADIAVPTVFPRWAYADQLNASQKEIRTAREQENARNPRDGIDFVPATPSTQERG